MKNELLVEGSQEFLFRPSTEDEIRKVNSLLEAKNEGQVNTTRHIQQLDNSSSAVTISRPNTGDSVVVYIEEYKQLHAEYGADFVEEWFSTSNTTYLDSDGKAQPERQKAFEFLGVDSVHFGETSDLLELYTSAANIDDERRYQAGFLSKENIAQNISSQRKAEQKQRVVSTTAPSSSGVARLEGVIQERGDTIGQFGDTIQVAAAENPLNVVLDGDTLKLRDDLTQSLNRKIPGTDGWHELNDVNGSMLIKDCTNELTNRWAEVLDAEIAEVNNYPVQAYQVQRKDAQDAYILYLEASLDNLDLSIREIYIDKEGGFNYSSSARDKMGIVFDGRGYGVSALGSDYLTADEAKKADMIADMGGRYLFESLSDEELVATYENKQKELIEMMSPGAISKAESRHQLDQAMANRLIKGEVLESTPLPEVYELAESKLMQYKQERENKVAERYAEHLSKTTGESFDNALQFVTKQGGPLAAQKALSEQASGKPKTQSLNERQEIDDILSLKLEDLHPLMPGDALIEYQVKKYSEIRWGSEYPPKTEFVAGENDEKPWLTETASILNKETPYFKALDEASAKRDELKSKAGLTENNYDEIQDELQLANTEVAILTQIAKKERLDRFLEVTLPEDDFLNYQSSVARVRDVQVGQIESYLSNRSFSVVQPNIKNEKALIGQAKNTLNEYDVSQRFRTPFELWDGGIQSKSIDATPPAEKLLSDALFKKHAEQIIKQSEVESYNFEKKFEQNQSYIDNVVSKLPSSINSGFFSEKLVKQIQEHSALDDSVNNLGITRREISEHFKDEINKRYPDLIDKPSALEGPSQYVVLDSDMGVALRVDTSNIPSMTIVDKNKGVENFDATIEYLVDKGLVSKSDMTNSGVISEIAAGKKLLKEQARIEELQSKFGITKEQAVSVHEAYPSKDEFEQELGHTNSIGAPQDEVEALVNKATRDYEIRQRFSQERQLESEAYKPNADEPASNTSYEVDTPRDEPALTQQNEVSPSRPTRRRP